MRYKDFSLFARENVEIGYDNVGQTSFFSWKLDLSNGVIICLSAIVSTEINWRRYFQSWYLTSSDYVEK